MDELVELATWAAGVELRDIPSATLDKALIVMAGDLAAIVGGSSVPELRSLRQKLRARSTLEEASIFDGRNTATSRETAALLNGVAGCWLELDGGYSRAPSHSGLYALPAAMAEAEAEDLSFGDVLLSLVISYEITARFAMTWRTPTGSVHPHAALSAIGAASAVAVARRQGPEPLLSALLTAAGLSMAGPYDAALRGDLVRNSWSGIGAHLGFMASDLATSGITGGMSTPSGVFRKLFGALEESECLVSGLSCRWAIGDAYQKIYSCCQRAHSAVEAALLIHAQLTGSRDIESVRAVDIETYSGAMGLNEPQPRSMLASRFSLPHAVASALVFGDAGVQSFTETALRDTRVVRLRDKIQMKVSHSLPTSPEARPARVRTSMDDGRTLEATCLVAKGGEGRPLTRAEFFSHVGGLTRSTYPAFEDVFAQQGISEQELEGERFRSFVARLAREGST